MAQTPRACRVWRPVLRGAGRKLRLGQPVRATPRLSSPDGERPKQRLGAGNARQRPHGSRQKGREWRWGSGGVSLAGSASALPSCPQGPRWRSSLSTRLPPQPNEAVRAPQRLARSYYGFNRRTWTSRYRQIYNSIQSVRHTQGRCKQGRGPESGCAKWARREAVARPGAPRLGSILLAPQLCAGTRGSPPSPERSRGPGPAGKLGCSETSPAHPRAASAAP